MAKKDRAKASAPSVTLAELQREPRRVVTAARRDGGISVVDDEGRPLFSLWLPVDPLPGWRG